MALGPFLTGVTDRILAASGAGARTEIAHSHPASSSVPARRATAVGLIVRELVANAIDYAHPARVAGRIEVASRSGAAGSLWIEVSDDGVGLPELFDPRVDGGGGLGRVHSLADQLGARLHFDDDGIGLSVRLDMPGPLPREAQP